MIDLLLRCLLYLLAMFLITVVYRGQYHETASATLSDAAHKTGKYFGWTVVLVLVMEACFWLFIN